MIIQVVCPTCFRCASSIPIYPQSGFSFTRVCPNGHRLRITLSPAKDHAEKIIHLTEKESV